MLFRSAKSQTPGSVVQPTLCSRFPGLGSSFFFLFHIPSPSPFSVLHRAGSGQLVNPQAGWLSHAAPGAAPSPPPGTCTTPQAFAKEPACQCRRHRRCTFDPWVRKSPWSRKCQTQCLEERRAGSGAQGRGSLLTPPCLDPQDLLGVSVGLTFLFQVRWGFLF